MGVERGIRSGSVSDSARTCVCVVARPEPTNACLLLGHFHSGVWDVGLLVAILV